MLSPAEGATYVGKVTLRARVAGPRPDGVAFHYGLQPKDWTKTGVEVAPQIWEATYDLASVPVRIYPGTLDHPASATAFTLDGDTVTSRLTSGEVRFRVDRVFTLTWFLSGDEPLWVRAPDGEGGAWFSAAARSNKVGYGYGDTDLWVTDAAGARVWTFAPWHSGRDGFGNGVTLAAWDGRLATGELIADGWYCLKLTGTGENGRHDSIARAVRVDEPPADVPAPEQPSGAWCTPAPVPDDPPLVETPYPPLPTPEGQTPTPPTTPAPTTPAVPLLEGTSLPSTLPAALASRALPPAGKQFTVKPLLTASPAVRKRGRLTLTVRCVAGCTGGQWVDLELWTVGATPRRKLAVRARVSRSGTLRIDRRVRGTLAATLELRVPQLGVELPVRVRP